MVEGMPKGDLKRVVPYMGVVFWAWVRGAYTHPILCVGCEDVLDTPRCGRASFG